MKVIMLNGSPNKKGCTFTALNEVAKILESENIETEIVYLGKKPIRDCTACFSCAKNGDNRCVFKDDNINELVQKIANADALIVGSPVYYANPSGRILSVLNRVFFAGSELFKGKPAAAVANARRAGTTAALDGLNKYFTIANMPVVPSSYWNMTHGFTPEDVMQDEEGLQTMRNLGRNMAWMLKSFKAQEMPKLESGHQTNFIK